MKTSDLVVGEWYVVKTPPYWSDDTYKALRKGRLVQKDIEKGWHKFEVHTTPNLKDPLADDFRLHERIVSSKSVRQETENPLPVPGTEFHKAWVQRGINDAVREENLKEAMSAMELMAARLEGVLADPDDEDAFEISCTNYESAGRSMVYMNFRSPESMNEFLDFCKGAFYHKYAAVLDKTVET